MSFSSILYPEGIEKNTTSIPPASLYDLHLDQLFHFIFEAKKEYELEEFFYTPIRDKQVILYRQEILKDLYNPEVRRIFEVFSKNTGTLRKQMLQIRDYLKLKPGLENCARTKGRLLAAAEIYTSSIESLIESLEKLPFTSSGLKSFLDYISSYQKGEAFQTLKKDTQELRARFNELSYCMFIKNDTIRVCKYNDEENLTEEIRQVFDKFKTDEDKEKASKYKPELQELRMEVSIMNMSQKLFPDVFKQLDIFAEKHKDFDNEILLSFSREIQFYLAWLEETNLIREAKLPLCIPTLIDTKEELSAIDFYDIMLAAKQPYKIITNSISLKDKEHILVITGPNQGGKTTYARALGQLHYLASLGLDTPGSSVSIPLIHQVLTHFEKEETIETLNGKLQDELERLHELRNQATEDSLILINEIFASTTTEDAVLLGTHMMDWLTKQHALALVVTFLDELASYNEHVVSLMCTIESEENHERVYKIIRKPADGHAYAMDIAKKYSLTKEQLERRLQK